VHTDTARELFLDFSRLAIVYVLVMNATYFVYTAIALVATRDFLHRRTKERLEQLFRTRLVPPISVLCPAYNEGTTIVESVRSLLRLLYSKYEVIVINDGSRDDTLANLVRVFGMQRIDQAFESPLATAPVRAVYASYQYPKLLVLDKENGGKADALNAGINASRYPLFCAVDADAILEENALLHLVLPMIDRQVLVPVSGGIVRAANGSHVVAGIVEKIFLPRKPIALFQILEYLRAFLTGRTAQASLNIMLIVSGAFGLFHKEIIKTIGGYDTKNVGEDFELVVRAARHLHERKIAFEVCFVPETVCWTEVPEYWNILAKQRNRWHRGMLQTLAKHSRMAFSRRYGRTGLLGIPYFWFFEVGGPIVELLGYVLLPLGVLWHLLAPLLAVLFFLISVGLGIILSLSALLLEELSFHRYTRWRELGLLAVYAILENLGYRQLTLFWRVAGTFDFFRRKRHWGTQRRVGFGSAA